MHISPNLIQFAHHFVELDRFLWISRNQVRSAQLIGDLFYQFPEAGKTRWVGGGYPCTAEENKIVGLKRF